MSTFPSSDRRVHLWLVLAVVLAADALDLIDSTLTTVAAPTIARDLGGSSTLIPWLGASYALALGSLLVLGGRLGDRYGPRRTFCLGVAGFTVASASCGLAPASGVLIVSRLVQGGFGALLIPQGFALLQRTFPRERLGSAFSLFGPVLGICAVGGPILAGTMINADLGGLGWRPMFLINLVIGTATLVLAVRVLPPDESRAERNEVTIDVIGAVLLTLGMSALLGTLILAGHRGWGWLTLAQLDAGLLASMGFVLRQRRAAEPLITPSVLHNRGFVSGLVLGVVFFAAVSGLLYVISLYLQEDLRYSPGATAVLTAPTAAGIVVASTASFRLIRRLGRTLIMIGLVITLAGTGLLIGTIARTSAPPVTAALLAGFFMIGLGLGACFGTIYTIAIADIDSTETGSASGALNAVQQLANATGAAAMSSIFLHLAASSGTQTATLVSLAVVFVAVLGGAAMVRLLPRKAPAEQ